MAETTLDFRFAYENNASFKLQKRDNDESWETVIELDENTHISDVWTYVKSICEKTFELEVDAIGVVMKA